MRKTASIHDLFHTPNRFMRSAQLERDFADPSALDNYIVTPAMAEAFHRVCRGLAPGSGHRAWRITGDYGVGKSSFALVLAHLLAKRRSDRAAAIASELGLDHGEQVPLWPVLVTGAREPIVAAVARGIADSLVRNPPAKGRIWEAIGIRARQIVRTGSAGELGELIEDVRAAADKAGLGLLLVVDELGKLLEFAALDRERGDVFVLQRLAEAAAGSAARPFVFTALLHQGFRAYAERLPAVDRHEWDKVAERFEEIVFDQPLTHTAALVSGALNLQPVHLPSSIVKAAESTAEATASMGWLGGETTAVRSLAAAKLYPLHPTLLPPLIRFFSRYGQNERSLFGFLLSSEPFGLQAFADRPAGADTWYGLPEFYDYIRAVFGHRLSGPSYQSNWLRISETVDGVSGLDELEVRALKVCAVLSLLDAEDLLATDVALIACLSPARPPVVRTAIATLVDRGLFFRRGGAGYRLWPSSSVNLCAALAEAEAILGELTEVTPHVLPALDCAPILARRHYIETGTLRHFEVRYTTPDELAAATVKSPEADGLLIVMLADTEAGRQAAIKAAQGEDLARREEIVLGVAEPLGRLAADVNDLRAWTWVADHTPELVQDPYAAAEVKRQLVSIRHRLSETLGLDAALRHKASGGLLWFWRGQSLEVEDSLTAVLSRICRKRFHAAPLVKSEILNRRLLSSAAAAARMRLIEGLLDRTGEAVFGIDPRKAPPERSMYQSIFERGRLHVKTGGAWRLTPPGEHDPLVLGPALREIERLLDAAGECRIQVQAILDRLAEAPWGVRRGLSPLLLILLLKLRDHELAVYENGTFLPGFSSLDAMRMLKRPDLFELQVCRVEGVRAEVFDLLAAVFASDRVRHERLPLDIVAPLSQFVARLPEYTRRAGRLLPRSRAVRDALLRATEPGTLLFRDLPLACELETFPDDQAVAPERAKAFVARLQEAIADLRSDHGRLLERLIVAVQSIVMPDAITFDRVVLASRASQVALAASAPRLKSFANRLRDPGISNEAWIDALASFIIAKPTLRWNATDEARCIEELSGLADLFHRVEAIALRTGEPRPGSTALGVTLTRADGVDLFQVVEDSGLPMDDALRNAFASRLPSDRPTRIQYLSRMLWDELQATPNSDRSAPSMQRGKAEER